MTSGIESPIKVVVRLKPISTDAPRSISPISSHSLTFSNSEDNGSFTFEFDQVLPEQCSQGEMFEGLSHMIPNVLNGRNATIMSYGQTGSGKTHTLIGDIYSRHECGFVPRAAMGIFSGIRELGSKDFTFEVNMEAVEIYCERIRDLLSLSADSSNLPVIQDRDKGVYVAGASRSTVTCEQDVLHVMQVALANRTIAATGMNSASSRSHCLVTIFVQRIWTAQKGRIDCGKLCLVDLAGSERQDRTRAAGQTLEEAKLINRSLSALGNVVHALADHKPGGHIQYRDSKLTRALQDCLGGNSETALIICCSPAQVDATESLSSLRFGSRASGIVNNVQANSQVGTQGQQATLLLADARAEAEDLRGQLAQLRANSPIDRENSSGGTINQHKGISCQSRAERAISLSLRILIFASLVLLQFLPQR